MISVEKSHLNYRKTVKQSTLHHFCNSAATSIPCIFFCLNVALSEESVLHSEEFYPPINYLLVIKLSGWLLKLLGVDNATVKKVLASWGPGKFDAELNLDGKAFRPDGKSAATLIPGTHMKGGFYQDGRFATLKDVVKHYNDCKSLNLSEAETNDLVEYLKSL